MGFQMGFQQGNCDIKTPVPDLLQVAQENHAAQGRTPWCGRLGGRLHRTRYAPAPRQLKCGVERPSTARRCRRGSDGRRRRCCRCRARPGRARRGPAEQRRRSRSCGLRSGDVRNPCGHAHHRDGPGAFLPLPFPVAPTVCSLLVAKCILQSACGSALVCDSRVCGCVPA